MLESASRRPHPFVLAATVGYLGLVAVATLGPPSLVAGVFDLMMRVANALPIGQVSLPDLEFIANVAMFVPLGFLFVLLLGPRRWGWALVVGVALTLGIEAIQAVIPGRVTDPRDLLANSGGALIGVVFGYIAVRPRRRALGALVIAGALVVGLGFVAGTGMPGSPALAEDTPVNSQLRYVAQHWSDRNVSEYGSLGDNDCVNFASQSLIARGWGETDEWRHDNTGGVHSYSPAWISSGAMADYFSRHPELALAVTDGHRERVALGDIVQFDWDSDGAVDHTGIVNRVETDDAGTRIYYASHSNDRESQSVDDAIELDGRGGVITYWHLVA